MENFDRCKGLIKGAIIDKIAAIQGVLSITFVGSFEHSSNFNSISDIDIIVVTDKLNKNQFGAIEKAAGTITSESCGLPNYNVILNMSFGPLKFNTDKAIVFHIMVYDLAGHRKHVNESPFTCFDWEQYPVAFGKSLAEIYPVNALQIDDINSTRRSLESYLDDVKSGVITFRKYVFEADGVIEQKETYNMDERHKKEYAYHIMKFLMMNMLKILKQENKKLTDAQLAEKFSELDASFYKYTSFFIELSQWKHHKSQEPGSIFETLDTFIHQFIGWLNSLQQLLPTMVFYRHAKTELNDGSFLGIGRNPDILPVSDFYDCNKFDVVVTGNLKRTVATGKLLNGKTYVENQLLNEINYGLAEGMAFDAFKKKYPAISEAWLRLEDPPFPEGESQADVLARLNRFINEYINTELLPNSAIVTHNVVIRALIGQLYKLATYKWFLLQPGHIESFPVVVFNNILIPAFSNEQRVRLRDQITQWKQ